MKGPRNPWKTLSSETVYKSKYFTIRKDEVIRPDGSEGIYEVYQSPLSVIVVALTKNRKIYLIGQYRYISDKYSLELPAGSSDNEDLLSAAKRELQEETGLLANSWEEVGTFYPSNGRMDEFTHIFLAQGLTETSTTEQEAEGIKEVRLVSFEEALEMIKIGEIHDGQTIIGIIQAAFYLNIL